MKKILHMFSNGVKLQTDMGGFCLSSIYSFTHCAAVTHLGRARRELTGSMLT